MPMTLGLASGLSSTAWMTAPATARAAPASKAANTRGRRTFVKIDFAASLTCPPVTHAASSAKLTDDEPTKNAAAVSTTSSAIDAMSTAANPHGRACAMRENMLRMLPTMHRLPYEA